MNLPKFLTNIITSFRMNGQSARARKAGQEHAQEIVGNYLDGFDERAKAMLEEYNQRFTGRKAIEHKR